MDFIIDYPEKVQCNICRKMIAPKKGKWDFVYLFDDRIDKCEDGLVFPRCEDCKNRAN